MLPRSAVILYSNRLKKEKKKILTLLPGKSKPGIIGLTNMSNNEHEKKINLEI